MRFARWLGLLIPLVLCTALSAQDRFVVTEHLDPLPRPLTPVPIDDEPLDRFVVNDTTDRTPAEPGASPVTLQTAEVHAAVCELLGLQEVASPPRDPAERDVVLRVADFGCPACDVAKARLANGIVGGRIRVEVGGLTSGGYPCIELPDRPGDRWEWPFTAGQVAAIVRDYPPVSKPVGAITVGTIKGKSQIATVLRALSAVGPGQVTVSWQVTRKPQLASGKAGLDVPLKGSATYEWGADHMRLAFQPDLRLTAQGWIGRVHQPVSGLNVTRDKLTVEIPGFIDLAKTLVE